MENLDFVRCWEVCLSIISKASANFNMRTRSPQIENDRTCIELKQMNLIINDRWWKIGWD